MIRVLLRQILGQLQGNFPDGVIFEYRRYKSDIHRTLPTAEKFNQLLLDCISHFFEVYGNAVFVLVDAFDEFRTTEGERTERKRLVTALHQVIAETNKAKLLITTRPEHRNLLRESFETAAVIEIKADLMDLDNYVNTRTKDESLGIELKEAIKSSVRENSQGLYEARPLRLDLTVTGSY